MRDPIERQDAIDAVEFGITYAKAFDVNTGESKELFKEGNDALKKAVERLKDLPSAQPERCEDCVNFSKTRLLIPQPEIIHCKDCKKSEHWYRDRRRCFLWSEDGVSVFDDGFCNYAERRSEQDEGSD